MLKRLFRKSVNTRVFPRLRLYNFVKYKLDAEPPGSFALANVRDISANGILFICKRELQKKDIISIAINFPGIEPIDVKAEVVRIRRTDAGEYEAGAHFITIDESKKQELVRRIEFILMKIKEKKSFLGQIKRAFKRG